MNSLSDEEISLKYENIEDKIPSVWPTWEAAGLALAQDLWCTWQVTDGELIRVIALVWMRVPGMDLSKHINPAHAYAGLYPERIRRITPEQEKMIDELVKKREEDGKNRPA